MLGSLRRHDGSTLSPFNEFKFPIDSQLHGNFSATTPRKAGVGSPTVLCPREMTEMPIRFTVSKSGIYNTYWIVSVKNEHEYTSLRAREARSIRMYLLGTRRGSHRQCREVAPQRFGEFMTHPRIYVHLRCLQKPAKLECRFDSNSPVGASVNN